MLWPHDYNIWPQFRCLKFTISTEGFLALLYYDVDKDKSGQGLLYLQKIEPRITHGVRVKIL